MMEWKTVKLGEIGRVVTGKTPATKCQEYYKNGLIHFIGPSDLSVCNKYVLGTEKHITEKGRKSLGNNIIPANSICVSCIGTIGYLGISTMPCATNQQINSIIVDEEFDVDFIFYTLKNLWTLFKSFEGQSTTLSILNKGQFSQIEVSVPSSLEDQRRIAAILSSLDAQIENNNRINRNLEAQAQALFKSWFVDFEPWNGQMPDDWKELPLSDVFDFLEGPGIRNWQYVTDEGTKFINIRCIQNNDIDVSSANMISNIEANGKYKHFMLSPWDIIMSTSGTLGRYAIVREEHLPLCLNTSVIRFRSRLEPNYAFMYSYLTSSIFKELLETMACGSVQANFGPTHLKQIKICVPSDKILQQYNSLIMPILQRIVTCRKSSARLAALRDTLLPKLMKGEIEL